jgi:hypothetical protein
VRLPLRRTGHCLDGRAICCLQHGNDTGLFALTPCSRLRCGPRLLMRRRLCNGQELSIFSRGRSPYARGLGFAFVCA